MDKKDFLSAMGVSGASLIVITCMCCSTSSNSAGNSIISVQSNVDFTVELNAPATEPLLTDGGYSVFNSVSEAHTTTRAYMAVQRAWILQSYPLLYQPSENSSMAANTGRRLLKQNS